MMKILILAPAALALWLAPAGAPSVPASAASAAADKYEIDPVHSFALFKIKHFNLGYVWGRINGPAGAIVVDEADPSKSSVEVELKAENVDTANEKRDQHLKGPDFFNAKQFPAITFKSASVKKTGDATYEVTGDFTLLGVSKKVTATLTRIGAGKDPWGGTRVGFEGSFTIKRSEHGMKHMLDGVGDDVHISVAFEGVKK
ncbi:MAG: YceI family protein [Planctomycetes bacterium]|nr:YceI family protein [Planctomycetota bacterium]